MWIASANGFVLIETAKEVSGKVKVKAFCREDFEGMVDLNRISEGPDEMGYFHVLVAKQELADILIKLVKSVDYDSFEEAISCHPVQGKKKLVYGRFLEEIGQLY